MAAEAAAADADDGGFEAFAEAPLTASADADAATTPAEADDPSFTAFEEAPAETDAAQSDGPPAEEDPWASFPEPVAAADAPAAAPTADAEPTPEGDAWAAFDGAAAGRRRRQPRRDVRLPRDVVVRARVGAGRRRPRRP